VTRRVPRLVLVALVVGLALHNLAMATLHGAGVTGIALDAVAAWKEVLLLVGLVAAIAVLGSVPRLTWPDRLALAYALVVVAYLLIPQSWLDGGATARGELLALRHHLLPIGAYALGRLVILEPRWWRRIGLAIVGVACAVAVVGLVDVYLVPLQWWRESGVPGWFGEQLDLAYRCLSGLPENWILNTGDEERPLRRLVSTFLSPLASAYVLVVALLLLAAARWRPWTLVAAVVVYAGLLWTHTRAALIALAVGLAVLALVRRDWRPGALALGSVGVSVVFVAAFPTIGPTTSYTVTELACLRANAAAVGGAVEEDPLTGDDASTRSHLRNLRDGLETVVRHPQGYGLGNAGVVASRTGVQIKAGESTYTELGVDTGVAGLAAFVGFLVALLLALRRRSAWLTASLAAVMVIGLQTDVLGVHWIAVVVFALAGAALRAPPGEPAPEEAL
jgi:hypothetical protein